MALTDYMTYDDVRAALGVSTDDIRDATLSLDVYSIGLSQEIDDVSDTLASEYLVIKAKQANARSSIEAKLLDSTKLYAVYSVARQLGASLPMFAPKDVTDGKTAVGRFSEDSVQKTIDNIEKYYEGVRNRLVALYKLFKADTTASTARSYIGVSSPTSDPVTG